MLTLDNREILPSSSSQTNSQTNSQFTKSKRTRKRFACFFCHEKKLRCDRIHPVCGRCQQVGNVCNYQWTSLAHDRSSIQDFGNSPSLGFINIPQRSNLPYNRLWCMPESSVSHSNDVLPCTLDEQTARIQPTTTFLESRGGLSNESGFSPCSNYRTLVDRPKLSSANETSHSPAQAIFYKSTGSRVQFHGSSSAMSVISSTPIILKQVCYFFT
jgi:Fungal Zn(2)-Cys(6) binuclear cluster domain